jgi:HAD superfamily hydrolase (TIGR01509 family)
MELSLVIFDCDGVLVDSEPISNRVLAESISELGVEIGAAEVEAKFKGETLGTIRSVVESRLGHRVPEGWLETFDDRRAEAFAAELQPVPGARAAIEGARAAGLDVCVASQARLAKTKLTLGLTELIDLFDPDALFSSATVRRPKPAPDLFLHAAAARGHDPAACVVIEDSVTGVAAARAAGMRVLAYTPDPNDPALTEAGGEPFSDMHDVPRLIAAA